MVRRGKGKTPATPLPEIVIHVVDVSWYSNVKQVPIPEVPDDIKAAAYADQGDSAQVYLLWWVGDRFFTSSEWSKIMLAVTPADAALRKRYIDSKPTIEDMFPVLEDQATPTPTQNQATAPANGTPVPPAPYDGHKDFREALIKPGSKVISPDHKATRKGFERPWHS